MAMKTRWETVKQGRKSDIGESNREPHGKLILWRALKVYYMSDEGNVLKMNFSVGVSM